MWTGSRCIEALARKPREVGGTCLPSIWRWAVSGCGVGIKGRVSRTPVGGDVLVL